VPKPLQRLLSTLRQVSLPVQEAVEVDGVADEVVDEAVVEVVGVDVEDAQEVMVIGAMGSPLAQKKLARVLLHPKQRRTVHRLETREREQRNQMVGMTLV